MTKHRLVAVIVFFTFFCAPAFTKKNEKQIDDSIGYSEKKNTNLYTIEAQ